LSQSKNATVSKVGTGLYCITPAAGIDPATTGVVATPDFHGDSTLTGVPPDDSAHVEFNTSHPSDCPNTALEVDTFNINNSNATGDHYNVEFSDEAFFFIIP
jgi:hypothetical protein